jgi:hypothetical protein
MKFNLKEKTAIVTGGGSGIGKAISKTLAEQGANVHILELNVDTAQESANEIVTEGGIAMIDESGYCIENANRPRVDMSFSKNGNQSFSNIVSNYMNPQGKYRNQINWHRMGSANEFTIQLRFWGMQRIVAKNGEVSVF